MEQQELIKDLFKKYMQGTALDEERRELEQFVAIYDNDQLSVILEEIAAETSPDKNFNINEWENVISEILVKRKKQPRIGILRNGWLKYAAAIIIVFGIGAYLWNIKEKKTPETAKSASVPVNNDVLPGGDKAILTLSGWFNYYFG